MDTSSLRASSSTISSVNSSPSSWSCSERRYGGKEINNPDIWFDMYDSCHILFTKNCNNQSWWLVVVRPIQKCEKWNVDWHAWFVPHVNYNSSNIPPWTVSCSYLKQIWFRHPSRCPRVNVLCSAGSDCVRPPRIRRPPPDRRLPYPMGHEIPRKVRLMDRCNIDGSIEWTM